MAVPVAAIILMAAIVTVSRKQLDKHRRMKASLINIVLLAVVCAVVSVIVILFIMKKLRLHFIPCLTIEAS